MTAPLQTDAAPPKPAKDEAEFREVRFEYTPALPEILQHLQCSLLVSTYQAGKLMVVGVDAGQIKLSFLNFDQPMGVAVGKEGIAIGSRGQVHLFRANHDIAASIGPPGSYNGCFVPQNSAYTGNIHGHDLAWGEGGLWVVNTLFSCLCTLKESYSFVPRWRPPFVSQLIDQDRCHLNGMAMHEGRPRFVTVLAESDEPAGWRPTKATSGCIVDVPSGKTLVRGLSMPHSPRVHADRLWFLNSGEGTLATVDLPGATVHEVGKFPGYTRGLSFAGQFAFVGLSKIRETNVFGGLPIAERREDLRCGVAVFDLHSKQTVAVLQFHSGLEEIFAVDVIPGVTNPLFAGAVVDNQARDVWVLPQQSTTPTST